MFVVLYRKHNEKLITYHTYDTTQQTQAVAIVFRNRLLINRYLDDDDDDHDHDHDDDDDDDHDHDHDHDHDNDDDHHHHYDHHDDHDHIFFR